MTSVSERSSSTNRARLGKLLRQYRQPNNTQNIRFVAVDLLTAAALIVSCIWLIENRLVFSIPLFFLIPFVGLAVVLIGACQHRLAGLGHEGSHHVLFRNRWLNELVADWVCMFPLFTTTDHYRSLHLGHHRWVNDHEKDPEFHNLGRARRLHEFPMNRWQFVLHFVSRILWPVGLLRYSFDNMQHGSIGITQKGAPDWKPVRPMFIIGAVFAATVVLASRYVSEISNSYQTILGIAIGAITIAGLTILCIPERFFYRSGYPGCYGPKLRSWMRLTFVILLANGLTLGSMYFGGDWVWYFRVLWVLPLLTGFPYFMLLRDAYQHANTDEGRYTNSRVMFPDPFSRWAIFMYGSDIHLTHHLHPNVPHYKLRRLHESLKRRSPEYAQQVVETYGTFRRTRADAPCLVETIETSSWE